MTLAFRPLTFWTASARFPAAKAAEASSKSLVPAARPSLACGELRGIEPLRELLRLREDVDAALERREGLREVRARVGPGLRQLVLLREGRGSKFLRLRGEGRGRRERALVVALGELVLGGGERVVRGLELVGDELLGASAETAAMRLFGGL